MWSRVINSFAGWLLTSFVLITAVATEGSHLRKIQIPKCDFADDIPLKITSSSSGLLDKK